MFNRKVNLTSARYTTFSKSCFYNQCFTLHMSLLARSLCYMTFFLPVCRLTCFFTSYSSSKRFNLVSTISLSVLNSSFNSSTYMYKASICISWIQYCLCFRQIGENNPLSHKFRMQNPHALNLNKHSESIAKAIQVPYWPQQISKRHNSYNSRSKGPKSNFKSINQNTTEKFFGKRP